LRWRKLTDIFLLTKPPASPRARLYACKEDMYARGVIAREYIAAPENFYGAMV